jgi:ParB-like chromosome segregation protein Spo0J
MTRRSTPEPEIRWEGPDEFRPLLVPIDQLHLDPRNPRQGQVRDIAASLRRFGQRRLAVVNAADGNLIEAGNHMTIAARDELGWTHIAAIGFDDDPQTATAFGLADNHLADKADTDAQLEAELLAALDDLDGTGWTEDERDKLIADAAPGTSDRDDVTLTPFTRAHVLITCELDEVPAVVAAAEAVAPDARIRTGAN